MRALLHAPYLPPYPRGLQPWADSNISLLAMDRIQPACFLDAKKITHQTDIVKIYFRPFGQPVAYIDKIGPQLECDIAGFQNCQPFGYRRRADTHLYTEGIAGVLSPTPQESVCAFASLHPICLSRYMRLLQYLTFWIILKQWFIFGQNDIIYLITTRFRLIIFIKNMIYRHLICHSCLTYRFHINRAGHIAMTVPASFV